ncbi:TonB-dependent receptor [Bradyrhizobium sp. 83012]|uniref:TonB-dependent receptor n=1 Tax=Bradyrhizobium aeschynomenes TaxID=2734909 RepID=A0ABX2CBD2_9BRAD|nr:TonB-dependent receptor [Bradyrhizobium aeschynomenes]NPU64539.1 TonB-dependent receptor [Bradyrhizobium aeschynomenes]
MFRRHVLAGASVIAMALVLLQPATIAHAQAERELPSVTVDAPRAAAQRTARKPAGQAAAVRTRAPKPAAASVANTSGQGVAASERASGASAARDQLGQSPSGQTATTIDRSRYDDRPAFTVGDILRESPGVSLKQGNGPRDLGISIRGSNARNGFGIRNIALFEDGFPVTQPDGLSRSDLIDPHAYGAVDVIRGPSSALYGNYATGGAINFRTRPGGSIDGAEIGSEGGSFGYLSNYMTFGKKVGNFEGSLFASDVRGNGYLGNGWFNTQTVNFLGTLKVTPDDRFTVKIINNELETRLPLRYTLSQFNQNPYQQGCTTYATMAAGCAFVSLNRNGFNTSNGPDLETALQAGLGRNDRRTIVGGRWEHDFDNTTTWRNQFTFDDRNISQPTGSTSAIGDYPSYNYMSDVTKRGEIFGLESTTFFGAFYNTLTASGDTRFVVPGGNAALGRLSANTWSETTNYGLRAREELKLTTALTAVAGLGWERTHLRGVNTAYTYTGTAPTTSVGITTADRQFDNLAPELALLYRLNSDWLLRARVATGYGTPQASNLFVLPTGDFGNNTQLKSQTNLGYDVGFDWTPNRAVTLSATGFYEFFRNEIVTQAVTGAKNTSYTFNAPRSEHKGVELAADWRFLPGWRFTAAYTYLDQTYTDYTENLASGSTLFSFNRAGNKIPGISPNELTARLGYDHDSGRLAGLGGFVELQWKDSFYMDNGNLQKAPGYELVNLNVHYKTELASETFKSLNVFFEVRNVFDRTYIASANNVQNAMISGVQSVASTGTIYAGSPRAFLAGMKVAFR